jgi:hypothetical protein
MSLLWQLAPYERSEQRVCALHHMCVQRQAGLITYCSIMPILQLSPDSMCWKGASAAVTGLRRHRAEVKVQQDTNMPSMPYLQSFSSRTAALRKQAAVRGDV